METTIRRVPTSVRFTSTLYDRIQKAAIRENRSVSSFIEMAVQSFLDEEPNETTKAAIEEARSGKPLEKLDIASFQSYIENL